jgi:hypothetical protein
MSQLLRTPCISLTWHYSPAQDWSSVVPAERNALPQVLPETATVPLDNAAESPTAGLPAAGLLDQS